MNLYKYPGTSNIFSIGTSGYRHFAIHRLVYLPYKKVCVYRGVDIIITSFFILKV
jgi:hypothetical protein